MNIFTAGAIACFFISHFKKNDKANFCTCTVSLKNKLFYYLKEDRKN